MQNVKNHFSFKNFKLFNYLFYFFWPLVILVARKTSSCIKYRFDHCELEKRPIAALSMFCIKKYEPTICQVSLA